LRLVSNTISVYAVEILMLPVERCFPARTALLAIFLLKIDLNRGPCAMHGKQSPMTD
jgi:hypothetical protein